MQLDTESLRLPSLMPSKKQFEEAYANRSKITLRKLKALGRRAYPCHCQDDSCEGWQMAKPTLYWEDRLFRERRWWMWIVLLVWKMRLSIPTGEVK